MFTMDSLIFLAIAVAILFAAIQRGGDGARTMSEKTHRAICWAAVAAGILVRLVRLTSLPAGISAEEALVGVQAKALWQTGDFLFGQGLTTQLSLGAEAQHASITSTEHGCTYRCTVRAIHANDAHRTHNSW